MGLNLNEQGLVRQYLVRIAFSFGSKCYRNFLSEGLSRNPDCLESNSKAQAGTTA